ncbi:unnamed protein product [marine sediment metagenome]|uniref:Penicillin-binding protein dimerisation domain-containing protein n=1 Tax=marine sediment metagenome TaxID=412755 RepID=X0Z9C1_9ZZZZ
MGIIRRAKDEFRPICIFLVIILFFLILSYRLINLQVLDAQEYVDSATNQHDRDYNLFAQRGKIYDKNGSFTK